MKNGIKTSKKVAKVASKALRDPKSSKTMKELGGSDLRNAEANTTKKPKRPKSSKKPK